MSEIYALGVFRIPIEPEQAAEFGKAWREFAEKFGDFEGYVYVAKPDENREVALLNSVVDILQQIEELEGAVEAESQFVEALLEDEDWGDEE